MSIVVRPQTHTHTRTHAHIQGDWVTRIGYIMMFVTNKSATHTGPDDDGPAVVGLETVSVRIVQTRDALFHLRHRVTASNSRTGRGGWSSMSGWVVLYGWADNRLTSTHPLICLCCSMDWYKRTERMGVDSEHRIELLLSCILGWYMNVLGANRKCQVFPSASHIYEYNSELDKFEQVRALICLR